MAIEVKKKTGETTRSLLRRFSRRIQQSGVLIRARKSRFLEKDKSKGERRSSALRRVKIVDEKKIKENGSFGGRTKMGKA